MASNRRTKPVVRGVLIGTLIGGALTGAPWLGLAGTPKVTAWEGIGVALVYALPGAVVGAILGATLGSLAYTPKSPSDT